MLQVTDKILIHLQYMLCCIGFTVFTYTKESSRSKTIKNLVFCNLIIPLINCIALKLCRNTKSNTNITQKIWYLAKTYERVH